MKIFFTDSDFWTNRQALKRKSKETIATSYKEVKKLLPYVSDNLSFVVQVNEYECIPNTGGGGHARNFELILAFVDPRLPKGEDGLIESLKTTAWHELNHTARYVATKWNNDLMAHCITEGLATVFERDYADYDAPWGKYKVSEVKPWVKEVLDLGNTYSWSQYMFQHTDGRKWIGYKVGTYLVDQAIKKSGKSVVELTGLEYKEIIKLAS